MRPQRTLPVGVACAGDPRDPWDWSGIPHNICLELTKMGHPPVWIDARPTGHLFGAARRLVAAAHIRDGRRLSGNESVWEGAYRISAASAEYAGLLGIVAATRRLRASAPRQVIQLRGDFLPARGTRTVLFEDIIVPQVAAHRWWAFKAEVPDHVVRRRVEHQARAHRRAVASCVTSGWVRDAICQHYGVPYARVHVVGQGAQTLVDAPPRAWDTPKFLWIGLDWQRKAGDRVLRAFAEVRRLHPAAELHMVGAHPRLEADGVVGHGRLDRDDPVGRRVLAGLLSCCTCFVMPSLLEPAGTVYIEAGLAGMPSIGTTVGGAGTSIGAGGRLVDPADAVGLVRAMIELSEPGRARDLGAIANDHAKQFTWRKVTERIMRALNPRLAQEMGYSDFLT